MKKIVKTIGFLLIAVLLVSCASGGRYKLIHENGQYYVMLDEEVDKPGSGCVDYGDDTVVFHSFEEMISDIKTGNFTEEELVRLLEIAPRWKAMETQQPVDRIYFPNLDALLMPKVQVPYDTFRIDMSVPSYRIFCCQSSANVVHGYAHEWYVYFEPVASEEALLNRLSAYKNWHSLIPNGRDEERKAMVYDTEKTQEYMWVYDPVLVEGRTLHIVECVIDREKGCWTAMIGVVDGAYFYEMRFDVRNGRPELEWYYSFGMEPYAG